MAISNFEIPAEVKAALDNAKDEGRRTVMMTCGISGSGKSTLAQNIETQYPNFERLSIDKTVLAERGIYDVDYPASKYSEYQEEAEGILKWNLKGLLNEGRKDAVIDLAFYSRDSRDEYREMVKAEGKGVYRIVLVVFRGDEETLWRRIEVRRKKHKQARSGKEGMSIDRETLRIFLDGFEWPDGEGEIVVKVE